MQPVYLFINLIDSSFLSLSWPPPYKQVNVLAFANWHEPQSTAKANGNAISFAGIWS